LFGTLDGERYFFRVDTGSDISILCSRKVSKEKKKVFIRNLNLRYPMGEEVIFKYKALAKIQLRKYSEEIPLLVAEISENCLLGIDFLKVRNLENVFDSFRDDRLGDGLTYEVSRIEEFSRGGDLGRIPNVLREFLIENFLNLNNLEKKTFY